MVLETTTLPIELCPYKNQRLPILPGGLPPSTFGVCRLNCCVRHGNRWIPAAIATEFIFFRISYPDNCIKSIFFLNYLFLFSFKSSPRSISTGPLHTSLCFHSRPIYHVVFMGPYLLLMRNLIFRLVSRLDAFSVYPSRT